MAEASDAAEAPFLVRGGAGHKSLASRSAQELALLYEIPIAERSFLSRGGAADGKGSGVCLLSLEASGSRVLAGGKDGKLRLYDFGGMDVTQRPFKVFVAEEGYIPVDAVHGPAGKFFVASGSSAPKVYDRDGVLQVDMMKGDMYLKDQSNTRGHTQAVTALRWHPQQRNETLTASLDGTVRLWDIEAGPTNMWDKLENVQMIKVKTAQGTPIMASALCVHRSGQTLCVGAHDGAVKLYDARAGFEKGARPKLSFSHVAGGGRHHLGDGYVVTAVEQIPGKDTKLVSRAQDHTVKFWDVRMARTPTKVLSDIFTPSEKCDLTFSPDGRVLLVGVAGAPTEEEISGVVDRSSRLLFFDVLGKDTRPLLRYADPELSLGMSVTHWNRELKQVFCGADDGRTQIHYHPVLSEKGTMLSSTKSRRQLRDSDLQFGGVGEIYVPGAQPRKKRQNPYRSEQEERKARIRPRIPQNGPFAVEEATKHKGTGMAHIFMQDKKEEVDIRMQDPREALLKYAGQKGDIVDHIYQNAAPEMRFAESTLEQLEEDYKKKQEEALDQNKQ
eukprot:scaffold7381_cov310-Pinguiococcus_pyrenoidosus.AAC.75